ncbi:MAG: T9SS type A sorting domain-containing protein [Sphingobacteriales bacterium JAD_PAG50586_3]|nr:MAG: T9SS type A sorting domain-containing protein [Sphingobacteriales bacterium JAD_PAG50586_3]
MKKQILCLFSVFCGLQMQAQVPSFTVIDTLEEGAYGAAAWGDCNNDGFMDLCYISQILPDAAVEIYINNNNVFTRTQQGFPLLYNPAVVWGDLNGDGFDDVVMNGADSTLTGRTFIYKSNGNGTFTEMSNAIPGLSAGSVDVADYNNDNLLDIAITGNDSVGQNHAYIYKNNGNFSFTNINATITGIHFGELQWGDFNNDNLADLVISGRDIDASTKLYKNMGNDVFTQVPQGFAGAAGTADWFDYNEDGWLDMLLTGTDSTFVANITVIYTNNQDGTFTLATTNLPEFGEPSKVDIADINNDGHSDILLMGGNEQFLNLSAIALGNGTATFELNAFNDGSIMNPNVEAADIDNDGDIDLLWGFYILRNDSPLSITEQVNDDGVVIYPQPAKDIITINSKTPLQAITIHTINGSKVFYTNLNALQTSLDISHLANGMYIVEYDLGDTIKRTKLIISR